MCGLEGGRERKIKVKTENLGFRLVSTLPPHFN